MEQPGLGPEAEPAVPAWLRHGKQQGHTALIAQSPCQLPPMTRNQRSQDVGVEIPINKHSCRVAGPSGHHRWQPRRDHKGTVGLALPGGQVAGTADGRLRSDCLLEDGTGLSTVCLCPHRCDT